MTENEIPTPETEEEFAEQAKELACMLSDTACNAGYNPMVFYAALETAKVCLEQVFKDHEIDVVIGERVEHK